MTPETDLDDPADEKDNGECESADGVEVCKKEAYGVNDGVNKADKWEESGVENEPAVELVSREVTRHGAATKGKA